MSVIAKMIQRITCYEQMLAQKKLTDNAQDEVREELAQTARAEVEAVGFTRVEAAFHVVLRAKVDLLNTVEERERALHEELRVEKETHEADLISLEEHLKVDFERLEQENAMLKAWVAKNKSRISKLKDALKTFTKRAMEKYTEGFCLARAQILGRNPNAHLSALNAYEQIDVHPSWYGKEFFQGVPADHLKSPN